MTKNFIKFNGYFLKNRVNFSVSPSLPITEGNSITFNSENRFHMVIKLIAYHIYEDKRFDGSKISLTMFEV
jgi:hypothetical protein